MITSPSEKDFAEILNVWELSVRATHHFLPEDYLQLIKELLPSILPKVPIYISRDDDGAIDGFLGVAGKKIEMLFIHPDKRGQGIGRTLTRFAIDELSADEVDVNEQNDQATGFYERMGFTVIGRSDTDGLGKPFPILHMRKK